MTIGNAQPAGTTASGGSAPQPLGPFTPGYQAPRMVDVPGMFDPNTGLTSQAGTAGPYNMGPHPLYYDGDQYQPASWDTQSILTLQQKLHDAGLLKTYRPGVYGPDEVTAFSQVMALANGAGTTWGNYLDYMAANPTAVGGTASTHSPLVVRLKNPDDIRAVLQTGAKAVFGKFMSEDDIQKFISAYQGQQAAYQTAAYQATGYNPETGQQDLGAQGQPTAQGATLTEPPTTAEGMQTQFTRQMYQDHPVTAEMAEFVANFDNLLSTLAPGYASAGGPLAGR